MTLATLRAPMVALPLVGWEGSSSVSSNLLDALGEKFAMIVTVPKDGTIEGGYFNTGTVTTWQDLSVSLQTVDGNGEPTGTNYGGSAAATVTGANTDDNVWKEFVLATPATAVKGDRIAIVIEFASTVGNLNIRHKGSNFGVQHPFTALYTGSWSKNMASPLLALRYDDDTYPPLLNVNCGAPTPLTFNSGTGTADEYGIKFVADAPCRVVGALLNVRPSAAGADFEICVYLNGSTTASESVAYDGDETSNTVSERFLAHWFSGEYVLDVGDYLYITVRPTTSNNVTLLRAALPVSGAQGAMLGSGSLSVRRLDQGSWDETQDTFVPYIYVISDQFDDGAGGGGGLLTHPGMAGGMRA